jgi:hypothetical protein
MMYEPFPLHKTPWYLFWKPKWRMMRRYDDDVRPYVRKSWYWIYMELK